MAQLVIRIPPRPRLAARGSAEAEPGSRLPVEFDHVLAGDGRAAPLVGRAAPALLPKAVQVVAVLAPADVSWHRLVLPKAPAGRLRAALAGALEESLLDDEGQLHFAVAPDAAPGAETWVAVTHRGWLAEVLAELERHGVAVDRVVPAAVPSAAGAPVQGHAWLDGDGADVEALRLLWSDERGVHGLRAEGGLARALLPASDLPQRWTSTPAAAAVAERWLGRPVDIAGEAELLLRAAASAWNLRQFELAPRHRGLRALREVGARLASREWRPVRWGLAALVVVQLVGLNAWAWQQRREVDTRRQAMVDLLRATHPQVRAVLDAPAQMERETERLRTAAGRPGDGDLERLLEAAAAAWPDGQGPTQTLRFDGARLTLGVGAWSPDQVEQFRQRLQPAGYAVEATPGAVVVSRATGGRGA